jgi:hypothetical protein
MGPPGDAPDRAIAGPAPTADELRWLHDKYERLSAEEGQLSTSRTSYYAAIGTVLITGLIIVAADFQNEPSILALTVTFLAGLGLLISFVWAVLLHRTNDAQNLWREAARRLEESHPPLEGEWRAPITLRSGYTVQLDLLRPYLAHQQRFSSKNPISWMDRVDPATLTEILPKTFLALWGTALGLVWAWYLFLR